MIKEMTYSNTIIVSALSQTDVYHHNFSCLNDDMMKEDLIEIKKTFFLKKLKYPTIS